VQKTNILRTLFKQVGHSQPVLP